jgi:hypothetical protein
MRLTPAEHERWYGSVWAPMQRRLGERFDAFMRDYLVKDGLAVRPDEVYQEWRRRLAPLPEAGVQAALRELSDWSLEYEGLLHPRRETEPGLRRRLERLLAWSSTMPDSLHPLLLRLRADHRRGELDRFEEVLLAVESYLVRRLFTAAPARDENQLLLELYNGTRSTDAFLTALARPEVGWPGDDELIEGIVRYPLYFGSHPDQRKLILQALEDSYEHRAPPRYDLLEPQLITPLLPRPDWLAEVGLPEDQYWRAIGVLGNFTWLARGRAPDLGVAERKRELLRMARYDLGLVRDLADGALACWTSYEIERRSRRLAERAARIWPGPPR